MPNPPVSPPPTHATKVPTRYSGTVMSGAPTPNGLPGRPVAVGPNRYQLLVALYSSVKSRSRSLTSDTV